MAATPIAAALPRRSHKAYSDVWQTLLESEGLYSFCADVHTSAEEYCKWAESTKGRRANLLARFVDMHNYPPWKAYLGDEWHAGTMMERARAFLTVYAQVSSSATMPGQKMNYDSLTCVRYDLYGLISEFCPHARANKVVRDDWFTQLDKHCQYLRVTLNIPAAPKEDKLYYGKDEMLLLAETALANSIHMNNTLQHIVLWTMIFYTAGRPGSYLSTAYYKDWYILYEDILLIRSEEDPTTFGVDLRVRSWKGGHGAKQFTKHFRMSPVQTGEECLFDLALLIALLALRRGALRDHTTLDELLNGREREIRWKEDVRKDPFFARGASRGMSTDPKRPMHYENMRHFLLRVAQLAGLGKNAKIYHFRRAGVTAMLRVLGSELTKMMVNHRQESSTLFQHYAFNDTQVDLTAMRLYGKQSEACGFTAQDAPAMLRPVPTKGGDEALIPLSFDQALVLSEELQVLHMQKLKLRHILASQTLMIEDVLAVMDHLLPQEIEFLRQYGDKSATPDDENEGLPGLGALHALYDHILVRAKRHLANMRARYAAQQQSDAFARARPPTLDELEVRAQANEGYGPILRVLRLLAAEGEDEENYGEAESEHEGEGQMVVIEPEVPTSTPTQRSKDVRSRFMQAIVSYEDEFLSKGPQPCGACAILGVVYPDGQPTMYDSLEKVKRHCSRKHPVVVLDHRGARELEAQNTARIIAQTWGSWRV